jgi:hypothetical protein
MKRKIITTILLILLITTACSSGDSSGMTDEEAMNAAMTAIAETEVAQPEKPTITETEVAQPEEPSMTAAPTRTKAPTVTQKPPTDTPELEMGTFSNPYPFDWKENATWWIEYEDWLTDTIVKYEVGITDLAWGDECWSMVKAANSWNDPPEEGTEYLCIKIWVKNIGENPIDSLSVFDFVTVSDGNLYKATYEVDPSPAFDVDGLFPGGESEGWGIYVITEGDNDPLFSYARDPLEINSLIQLIRP